MTRLLLLFAALMVACSASPELNCDLSNPGELSRCLKTLLENSREKIRREVDPLRPGGSERDGVRVSNIRVNGLSGYSVEHLDVSFPRDQQIALSARIAWPHINADMDVRAKKCKRIIFKLCATVRARPHVSVDRSAGSLTATLTIGVNSHGKVTVTPSNIDVGLSLPKIKVKANVRGAIGAINRLFGDPASRIATRKANDWWRGHRGEIEGKAEHALAKAVREEVAPRLADLLKQ